MLYLSAYNWCGHMQHSSLSTHATQFTVNPYNTVHCGNSKCALHWHQVRAHSRHCLQNALIFSSQHVAPEDYQPLSSNLHAKLGPGPTCVGGITQYLSF